LLLQRLYSELDNEKSIDALGERMVAYFGAASVDPAVVENLTQTYVTKGAKGVNRFEALLELELSLKQRIREAWKANQAPDGEFSLGLDNFLSGLSDTRDTAIYLLQQRLA